MDQALLQVTLLWTPDYIYDSSSSQIAQAVLKAYITHSPNATWEKKVK